MKYNIDLNELKRNFLLTDTDGNEIEWGINHFPDGQLQFWSADVQELELVCSVPDSFSLDIFNQILFTWCIDQVTVLYLYGARSDKWQAGDRWVTNVFDMVCRNIQDECGDIRFLSPHSKPWFGTSNYFIPDEVLFGGYDTWVFPDESAYVRFGSQMPNGVTPVVFQKTRDQETGDIIEHRANWPQDHTANKILVIDDLCDGGRTFMDVANIFYRSNDQGINWSGGNAKLDLYVTHGVFSGNACKDLSSQYDNIFVTNSLRHVDDLAKDWPKLKVTDVWDALWNRLDKINA